jgi:hypothetical protein
VRKLNIRYCVGFLQSDAFFHCVAGGGLRQLEQLNVRMVFNKKDEDESGRRMAQWIARQRACAPWIRAAIKV